MQQCRQYHQREAGCMVFLGCEARRLQVCDAGSVELVGGSEACRLQVREPAAFRSASRMTARVARSLVVKPAALEEPPD